MVRATGIEPAQAFRPEGFSYRLRLSPPRLAQCCTSARLWSGLYLHRSASRLRCCPSSLYTFPCAFVPGLGSGLPVTGSPEFGQFCTTGFPAGTQAFKSLASTSSATPALCGQSSNQGIKRQRKSSSTRSCWPEGRIPALPSFRGRGFGFDRSRLVNARRVLAAEPEWEAPALLRGQGLSGICSSADLR